MLLGVPMLCHQGWKSQLRMISCMWDPCPACAKSVSSTSPWVLPLGLWLVWRWWLRGLEVTAASPVSGHWCEVIRFLGDKVGKLLNTGKSTPLSLVEVLGGGSWTVLAALFFSRIIPPKPNICNGKILPKVLQLVKTPSKWKQVLCHEKSQAVWLIEGSPPCTQKNINKMQPNTSVLAGNHKGIEFHEGFQWEQKSRVWSKRYYSHREPFPLAAVGFGAGPRWTLEGQPDLSWRGKAEDLVSSHLYLLQPDWSQWELKKLCTLQSSALEDSADI